MRVADVSDDVVSAAQADRLATGPARLGVVGEMSTRRNGPWTTMEVPLWSVWASPKVGSKIWMGKVGLAAFACAREAVLATAFAAHYTQAKRADPSYGPCASNQRAEAVACSAIALHFEAPTDDSAEAQTLEPLLWAERALPVIGNLRSLLNRGPYWFKGDSVLLLRHRCQ